MNKDIEVNGAYTVRTLLFHVHNDIADFIDNEMPRLSGHDYDFPIEIDAEDVETDPETLRKIYTQFNLHCADYDLRPYLPDLLGRIINVMTIIQNAVDENGDIDVVEFHLL